MYLLLLSMLALFIAAAAHTVKNAETNELLTGNWFSIETLKQVESYPENTRMMIRDCKDVKHVIAYDRGRHYGFGSDLIVQSRCFSRVWELGHGDRDVQIDSSINTINYARTGTHCGPNTTAFNCFFESTSPCSITAEQIKSAPLVDLQFKSDAKYVRMQDMCASSWLPDGYKVNGTDNSSWIRAICGQMRLNNKTQIELAKRLHRLIDSNKALGEMYLQHNYTSMHMRRGDKSAEAPLIPIELYADLIRKIGRKDVFAMSDSKRALDILSELLGPEYHVHVALDTQPMDGGNAQIRPENNQAALDLLLELLIMVHGQEMILDSRSNVSVMAGALYNCRNGETAQVYNLRNTSGFDTSPDQHK